jgi:TRAP-type mannitol/chloroaromatic compound transport system substrate-binding protein
MQRRGLIGTAATTAATALAAPALAQGRTEWRMVTIWPRNLPGPGVAAQRCADRIGQLSGGRLTCASSPPARWCQAPGAFDAVAAGTADLYHGVPSFWISQVARASASSAPSPSASPPTSARAG